MQISTNNFLVHFKCIFKKNTGTKNIALEFTFSFTINDRDIEVHSNYKCIHFKLDHLVF